jgi:DNA-binding CsgD family transcriptional regulator
VTALNRAPESVDPGYVGAVPPARRPAATSDALARLRGVNTNGELAERIPVELCRAGFGRVLFSLVRHNMWLVRSAHTTGDTALTAALLKVGRAHPRRICQPLPESSMLRAKAPILVNRPQSDPRVNAPLVAVVKPEVYIAAPVYLWQSPVALLHADAPTESGDVGPSDRDVLGVFAEGLGAIMERNLALERLHAMHSGASDYHRVVDALTGFLDGDLGADVPPPRPPEPADVHPLGGPDTEQLTRRERQVLNLLAEGKTNAQIAGRLFISEGTVKSHLRHIMGKLGAGNRTDAVARYRRLFTSLT